MADKKRNTRDEGKKKREITKNKGRHSKSKTLAGSDSQVAGERMNSGPRLPNALRKEVDTLNQNSLNSDDDGYVSGEEDGGVAGDVYEYEEEVAEEESKRNRRYDRVENYEYQLPEDFEDEDVLSDDEDDANDNEERHSRLLQEVTGMPALVFAGKRRKNNFVVSEAYPESEYNPTSDVLAGKANISIQDLLEPLHVLSDFSKLKRKMQKVDKEMPLQAPLPKPEQDKIQRAVVYGHTKKDVTKWEPLVKRNREAPTIYFDQNNDLGFSTVGAIASEFKPRTDFEKKMASLVHNDEVVEAERKDGAKILELNRITPEEVKDRQNNMAKMRSLLFRHEMKAKHIKKIKSKTFHRLAKKDRLKATGLDMQTDPEEAKELARKQEFKRAEERMTLKHKKSKFATRIIQRGLDVQDEGTRAALQEMNHEHQRLKRKMHSMKDTSSDSDGSSDEVDDDLDDSDMEDVSKVLDKAMEKTKSLMDADDDEMPKSSLLNLPFMARGLAKKKEAADDEAKLAVQEFEALKNKVDKTEVLQGSIACGRRVFGAIQKKHESELKADHMPDNRNSRSDSEDERDTDEDLQAEHIGRKELPEADVNVDLNVLREDLETADDSLFKTMDDVVKQPGAKTAYDVAIFASGSWKKINEGGKVITRTDSRDNNQEAGEPAALDDESGEEPDENPNEDSDSESEGQMIDGILSSGTLEKYELPSQEELIRRAFAGDDVEEEFEKAKEEALNEENPKPEEPSVMPGWGQWASVKKKRLPSWMKAEHENAIKKRDEALKKRKDARLKHVIISEKVDKKAEKLHTKTLPYPFTSQEVFEQSIRMPIGPEFNPATTFRAISRPEVVKRSGVIIKPISFEEVNPHEGAVDDQKKQSGGNRKAKGKARANKKTRVSAKSK